MTSLLNIPAYDRAQVTHWLGSHTVSKASSYVALVRDMQVEGDCLNGKVQGSAAAPYKVEIQFSQARQTASIDIKSKCSCPVSYSCKHVAAVLLAGIERRSFPGSPVRSELTHWLQGFRERTSAVAQQSVPAKSTQVLIYTLNYLKYNQCHEVRFRKTSVAPDGSVRTAGTAWSAAQKTLTNPPSFVNDNDVSILRLLVAENLYAAYPGFRLRGPGGALVLEKMLATGRLFATDAKGDLVPRALRYADPRPGDIHWQPYPADRVQPVLQSSPAASECVLVEPVWFIDGHLELQVILA